MSEVQSTFTLAPGEPAPPFSLPDGSGEFHALRDLAGEQGTIVIFACNHCPYVIHLAEAIGEFANDAGSRGIATVAINSNDVENYPADSPDKMIEFAEEYGWDFPYLYDESQDVAAAYSAACTPDFYLFDGDRNLVYCGQFDGSRPKNDKPITGDDLGNAIEAMLEGEAADERPVPSSGCNIKWKDGNAPPYFQ